MCQKISKAFHIIYFVSRSFIVYKESDNEFRTARTYPAMVLIEISVHDEFYIVIEAPGMRQLYVKLPLFDLGGMKDIK